MEILEKYLTILFNAFCFILLGYTVGLQVERYFKNEDVSTISFKSFERNEYPTYTICLEDNFKGDLLKYTNYKGDEIDFKGNKLVQKKIYNNPPEGKRIPVSNTIRNGPYTIKPRVLAGLNDTSKSNPEITDVRILDVATLPPKEI